MNKVQKIDVYSDCECPHCAGRIEYSKIYDCFIHDYKLYFDLPCPHCGKIIEVENIPIPTFKFSKVNNAQPN
jgi:hypothetical protein